jgi:hypothetical protein
MKQGLVAVMCSLLFYVPLLHHAGEQELIAWNEKHKN